MLTLCYISICSAPPPTPCKANVDLVFLIDGSSSIDAADFELCKKFVKDVTKHFTISIEDSHVGAVQFADGPKLMFGLEKYFSNEDVYKAIDGIQKLRGGTFLGEALGFVYDNVFGAVDPRPDIPQILIVMTDGMAEDDLVIPVNSLKEAQVTIFALGIGDKVKTEELNLMASDPDSDHAFKTGFDQLTNIVNVISQKACPGISPCVFNET